MEVEIDTSFTIVFNLRFYRPQNDTKMYRNALVLLIRYARNALCETLLPRNFYDRFNKFACFPRHGHCKNTTILCPNCTPHILQDSEIWPSRIDICSIFFYFEIRHLICALFYRVCYAPSSPSQFYCCAQAFCPTVFV